MAWNRIPVEIDKLAGLRLDFNKKIKAADPNIESTRCVFIYKDNPCLYMYTACDFLDNYSEITSQPIEKAYVYQLIDKKSIS